jgi:hypothetical protein
MIWLTWRQHRAAVIVIAGALTLLAVSLLPLGQQMAATYHRVQQGTSIATCIAHNSQDPICDALTGDFRRQWSDYSVLLLLLTFLPALAGIFLGAPLVAREVERGTHRFVWTQGITRRRWIVVQICGLVLLTLVAFGALALFITWWRAPLDQVDGSRFSYGFDLEGIIPVAYALFALAVGIAAGALTRRAVAAMALALGVFLAVRGVVEFVLRPQFLPPVTRITSPASGNPNAYNGDWILNSGFRYLDRQGRTITSADLVNLCHGLAKGGIGDFNACLQAQGVRFLNLYQPANRFWLFQGIESAIFIALALLLLALAIYWIRRRIA